MIHSTPRHLPAGTTLQNGKYRIVRVLGQGGFGITYLAEHSHFGEVALKELFLNSGATHCTRDNTTHRQVIAHFDGTQFEAFKKRFSEEANILFQLRRVAGVVHVLDTFEENSTVYFSMEYLRGEKLEDYVKKRNGLSEQEGLRIISSLSAILSEVHKRDILHRDVKPANVVIDESGNVHLIDFGIARSYVDEITETHFHTTFHSPRYSAPEQKIERSRMGTYSDVYSLGAMAYYVFTGNPPQSVEERLLSEAGYQSPKDIVPSLSAAVNDAITRSLEIKYQDRIQTAEDFLQALAATGPSTPPPSASGQENTIIDTASPSPENEDKTIVDIPPEVEPPQDDMTVIDPPPPHEETELDHEATLIDQLRPLKEKDLDWKRIKDWVLTTTWGRITSGALVILVLLLIIRACDTCAIQPESRVLLIKVTNAADLPVPGSILTISDRDTSFTTDNSGIFALDITGSRKKLKGGSITIAARGFLPKELSIPEITDDTTTVKLEINKIENGPAFCATLLGNWKSNRQDSFCLNTCDVNGGNNPGGMAFYNGLELPWSSLKNGDSIFIKLNFKDNSPFEFLVNDPFDAEAARLERKEGRRAIVFDRDLTEADWLVLSGRIVNNKNNRPLSTASITIIGTSKSVVTDAQGHFSLDVTNFTDSLIKIEAEGFDTDTLSIASIKDVEDLAIGLSPAETKSTTFLKGKVVDQNNQPLKNVQVEILGTAKRAVTNTKGEFSLDVTKHRRLKINITAKDYESQTRRIAEIINDRNLVIKLFPINHKIIRGKVADINGQPIEGADITIPGFNFVKAKTNKSGIFEIDVTEDWASIKYLSIKINASDRYETKSEKVEDIINSKPLQIILLDYSEAEEKRIFCENLEGRAWKHNYMNIFRRERTKTLDIRSCNPNTLSGQAKYADFSGTWQASHFSSSNDIIITVTVNDSERYIFRVYNPLDKEKIHLELIRQKGEKVNPGEIFYKQ